MADMPVQCGGCGAHFMLDPSGDVAGAACSECGGTRFFRHQPSPTRSDGTLRDIVDSDSQKDQGGNPLGEGTIMGRDGEQSLGGSTHQRDNFMHGHVAREDSSYPVDPRHVPQDQSQWMEQWPLWEQGQDNPYGLPETRMPFVGDEGAATNDTFNFIRPEDHEMLEHGMFAPPNTQGALPSNQYLPTGYPHNDPRWSATHEAMSPVYAIPKLRQGLPQDIQHQVDQMLVQQGADATVQFLQQLQVQRQQQAYEAQPFWKRMFQGDPSQSAPTGTLSHRDMRPPTLNMEPYPGLWSDEHVAGVKLADGFLGTGIGPNVGPNIVGDATNAIGDVGGAIGDAGSWALQHPGDVALGLGAGALALGTGGAAIPEELAAAGGAAGAGEAGAAGAGALDAASTAEAAPSLMNRVMNGVKGIGPGDVGKAIGVHEIAQPFEQALNGGEAGTASGAPGGSSGYAMPGASQAIPVQMLGSVDIPWLIMADMETPHSVKSVDEQHDDPEKQDQKEFNDGDKSPSNLENPNNEDSGVSGEDGVRQDTPGYGFGPDSPGIQRMLELMPLLMHYINNGMSGADDPVIQGLHQALEQEHPDYMKHEHPNGGPMVEMMIQQHNNKQPQTIHSRLDARLADLSVTPAPAVDLPVLPMPTTDMQPSNAQRICPRCGAVMTAAGYCPQCGYQEHPQGAGGIGDPQGGPSMPPQLARVGSGTQGPNTPEQIAAVQQYLMSKPHLRDQVPDVPIHPENYAHIMHEIQGVTNTAPLVDPSQAQPAPMPLPPGGQPGGMPSPDPAAAGPGGMPMQPMASFQKGSPDPGDDAAFGGKPGASREAYDSMIKEYGHEKGEEVYYATRNKHKHADANNMIPRCPKCTSATTSYMDGNDDSGSRKARCHACGNVFALKETTPDHVEKAVLKPKDSRYVLTEINPITSPAADQNLGRPQESQQMGDPWKDGAGAPLVEGQIYSLMTQGIAAPDEVEVLYKKPHELGLKLVGEFGNIQSQPSGHEAPDFVIHPDDLISGRYTFEPSEQPSASDNGMPPLGGTPGLPIIPDQSPTTDQTSDTYPNPGTVSSYLAAGDDDYMEPDEDMCHKCGGTWIEHIASSPTHTMHECARCGTAWETADDDMGRVSSSSNLDWIMSNSDPYGDDFWGAYERAQGMQGAMAGSGSRDIRSVAAKDHRLELIRDRLAQNGEERNQRLAGRRFSPQEQRALINEHGRARNSDQLNLSGTHYEGRTQYDPRGRTNGENAPDGHLIFGL